MNGLLPAISATLIASLALVPAAVAKSDAYNAGYVFGRILFIALIVAVVVWIVRRLRSRSG